MTSLSSKIVDVTLVTDTLAYAANELLVATQVISNAVFDKNRAAMLMNLVLVDEADQGVAMDVYFLRANNSFGTINNAPTISDASARDIVGKVAVAAADWKDLGGVRVATLGNLNIPLQPATDTSDVYVAVVNGAGAPTFGAADALKLRLGVTTM